MNAAQLPGTTRLGTYFNVRTIKTFLATVTCLLVIASAVTSYFITQRQDALKQVSRYNLTWVVSIAPVEVTRLEAAIAESTIAGTQVDQDRIQLRLDIVRNRISLLDNSEVADFIHEHADLEQIVNQLRLMVDKAQPLIDNIGHGTNVAQLLALVSPVGIQLVKLAAAANAHDAELVTREQAELSRLHTIFTIIIWGLTICGFGLIWVISWHNRLLKRAHAKVNTLVESLQDRDLSLNTQNMRFDVALNNMSQALCMADHEQRVIVCNVRFLELFELPASVVQPGARVADVVRAAVALGTSKQNVIEAIYENQKNFIESGRAGHFFHEDSNGHAIAVSHRPMNGSGWVATYEDISERRRVEARIHFMAHHDALTGLPNRLLFEEKTHQALHDSRLTGTGAAILCLDLDRFKDVNDSLGHPAGDQLLKLVAQRLLACARSGDVVARLGGDEFAILQSSAYQPDHAKRLARRLIDAIAAPYDIAGTSIVIGTSVGIAMMTSDQDDVTTLLKNADIALYQAKADGRGMHRLFRPEMNTKLQARRAMEQDLREAINKDELLVFYQPLFDLQAEEIIGFEALLRWDHPTLGMIPPCQFVPIAEEVGLITTIGEWVLKQACNDATTWPKHIKLAVNLSSVQFRSSSNLILAVRSALETSGLTPSRLELEITESALLLGNENVITTLHEMRRLGVEIALDDFGTGYSSLSYLRSFPFDKIKIDQSFVREMASRSDCMAIVHSVAQLAKKLGMTTTAEGVETFEQLEQVRAAGCTQAQGYYFSQPKPASDIAAFFDQVPTGPRSIELVRFGIPAVSLRPVARTGLEF